MHPTFGRYELLKRLAGGGMGEVYLARRRGIEGFEKLLVLKTLLPHLCEDEELIAMFKDEARVTAQLVHPNICQVFEFDQAAGVYYMAMEYLHGEDLRRLWRACERAGRPMPLPLTCRIVSDAAAGLDFAHSLRDGRGQPYGIVHRDVSPQNILVTFEGGVKVIDFGVAKAAGRAQHTRTGALKGKTSYMSPEQVMGAALDKRSDIFALGVVLHELLTGARLFKGDSDVQTLWHVRECHVPPPSEVNRNLPQSLDRLVLKALAKDPDDRYGTSQELRLAIEEWLVEQRMNASSAHLAEFLKGIYAERLALEARHGPLIGQEGAGSAPRTMATPRIGRRGRSTVATVLAATAAGGAAIVMLRPAPVPFQKSVAIAAATPVAPPTPPPRQIHPITVDVSPPGTLIYEGERLLGTSPRCSIEAEEGAHELRFHHDGYFPEKATIRVAHDGEEFHFRLRKRPPPQGAPLDIKVER